jgi:hypothetical protein
MKHHHLFAVYVRLIASASIGVLTLALLSGAVGEVSVTAAASRAPHGASGPSIQIVNFTGTVPLYDPQPEEHLSKTLFLSNAVTGEITLTLGISDTPPFTLYLPVLLKNYPLVPKVAINNDAPYTYRREVTLALTATLDGDTIDQVRLKSDGETWGPWQRFATPLPFTLTTGNGRKAVYAQFKSAAGSISEEGSSSILLFENGDFEQSLAIGWRDEGGGLPVVRVTTTADGTPVAGNTALLGKTDYACNNVPLGYAGLAQTVTVPSGGAKLKFQYFMRTQDGAPPNSDTYDDFEVYVSTGTTPTRIYSDANRVTTGLLCSLWWRVPGPNNPRPDPGGQTSGWYEKTIDLSRYHDQVIEIAFRNYSRYDYWLNTYTYLDEVRLEP